MRPLPFQVAITQEGAVREAGDPKSGALSKRPLRIAGLGTSSLEGSINLRFVDSQLGDGGVVPQELGAIFAIEFDLDARSPID